MSVRDALGWLRQVPGRLSLRLLVLFIVLALSLSAVFTTGMQRAIGGGWRGLVRPLVADYVDRLAADLGSPPDIAKAQALVQRLPLSVQIQGPVVQWDSHPHLREAQAYPPPPPLWPPPPWGGGGREHHRYQHREAGHGPLGRAHPHADDDSPDDSPRGFVLLTRETADGHVIRFGLGDVPWRQRPRSIGWFTLAFLLVLTLGAYALIRRWLRPLDEIREGAVRYGQGRFDAPIPVRGTDELGALAGQINTMAADLQRMLDAKRALLLAISHELRSPLTRARLNAELVEESHSRDALLRDLGEMRELISDLLESERLVSGHSALQCEPVDVALLVDAVVHDVVPDESWVRTEIDPELGLVSVDPARWRLLVRNLVGNALQHGAVSAAAPLVVSLQRDHGADGAALVLSVRDHGPGVAPEVLAQLGEAFYRPDAARQRSTGGVGLGLYLCRLVAQAHGAQLKLLAAEPGLEARVRLPLVG